MQEKSLEIKSSPSRVHYFVVIITLIAVVIVSIQTLTTKPKLWVDEGKTVELARNFLIYHTLDVQVAPSKFSEIAPLLQSTGYPVSIPLALAFGIFGIGPQQARIYMLIWVVLALSLTYVVATKFFSNTEALLSFLLLASFASFYDSGRTVVGEIPGFVFLLLGINYWLNKREYYLTGLLWGLAIVTKPSVFGLLILIFPVVMAERNLESIKKILKVSIGMIPAAVGWFIVVVKGSPTSVILNIIEFYKNPYNIDLPANFFNNVRNLPFSITIIYFTILFLLVITARYLLKDRTGDHLSLYNFVITYSIFAFIYYLRSPGWLRYILIAELLILFILPNALRTILKNIKQIPKATTEKVASVALVCLVIIQTLQMFTIAKISYSTDAPNAISFLNSNYATTSIATLNVIELSTFLKTDKRFNLLSLAGIPDIGSIPTQSETLPELIVTKDGDPSSDQAKNILTTKYTLLKKIGRFNIFHAQNNALIRI